MSTLLYTHSKQDLERIVEIVLYRIRKNDLSTEISNPLEDRLTQREAAELLNITIPTIIKWKKEEKIPYYQIGKVVFYSKKELLEIAKKDSNLRKIK